jgi:hypothetical protein
MIPLTHRSISPAAFLARICSCHRCRPARIGEPPGLAFVSQGTGAGSSMEPTPRLAGHRPLATETVTVAHTGAAALPVFAVGTRFCHRRDLSMQMTFLILHLGA